MATLGNMFMFVYILGFVMMLGYAGDYYTKYGFQSQISTTMQSEVQKLDNATTGLINATNTGINLNPFNGALSFPNPFQIFADVLAILFSIVKSPFVFVGALDLPPIIKTGLQGLLVFIGLYLVVTWFKGQSA